MSTSLTATSRAFVVLLLLALTELSAYATGPCYSPGRKDSVTNAGTEFLLVFQQNEQPNYTPGYQDVYLAALDKAASVVITSRAYPLYKKTITLAAYESRAYRISEEINVEVRSNELADDLVIKVVSTQPIICYGMNHKQYTTDAFLALPRNTASTEFRVMSYTNSTVSSGSGMPSQFAVAAFENGTKVTVIPSAMTSSGLPKGQAFVFTLDEGQCVQVTADPNAVGSDLTGSIVRSDKAVLVYGSHMRAEVPAGFLRSDGGTSRDHLIEAIPPVSAWGQSFVVAPFIPRGQGDIVRVLALNANTVVKLDGSQWGSIFSDGEYRDLLIKENHVIEADGPILVGEYAHTTIFSEGAGDPFFAIVPPVDQTFNDFTFFSSTDASFQQGQYVQVIAEESSKGTVKLDGVDFPAAGFTDIPQTVGGKRYALATIQIATGGAHRITTAQSAEKGLTILAYGFGSVDSYGYTAGALLKPLQAIAPAGDHKRLSIAEQSEGEGVRFRNMLLEKIWLDSIRINLPEDVASRYTVRPMKDIALDISTLGAARELLLELSVEPPLEEAIEGYAEIFCHTAGWWDLRGSKVPFTLRPVAAAAVRTSGSESAIAMLPNPAMTHSVVRLSAQGSGAIEIRIFDAVGREVRKVDAFANGSGVQDFTLDLSDLPSGQYVCELRSDALSLRERATLVVRK